MNRDIVRTGKEALQRVGLFHRARKRPGGVHRNKGVVPDYVHAEGQRVVGDIDTNIAQSDNAQRLSADLGP